jgi:thiamine pyrophosphokinase
MDETERSEPMSRCVIISACAISAGMKSLLRPDDFIIACDAGYRNCETLGCRADLVVGDFDSAPQPGTSDPNGLIVLPHVKDDTDTEYAAKLAAERGFKEVLLLGALGGRRLEHTLANIATGLGLAKRGIAVSLCDERTRVSYVLPGQQASYSREKYFYFSIFPLEGSAEGVELSGSLYELQHASLRACYPLGVSNEYAQGSQQIQLSCREGALLVVETLADG